MRRRTALAAAAIAAAGSLGLVLATGAEATTATAASATIAFSGTGTSMKVATSVKFTSTYTGSYNVRYDIFRSTSSAKTSPVKVNTSTVFTKTLATTKGKAYVYGPNSSKCAAGTTLYYYWVQGSVSDTTAGTVLVTSPVVSAKGCTSL
jgi:plastocyanin